MVTVPGQRARMKTFTVDNISMLQKLITSHWLSLHALVVMTGWVIYVTTSRARRQRRHPSAALAWVISLTLLPYLALPLYMVFGSRKVLREVPAQARPTLPLKGRQTDDPVQRFQQLAFAMGLPPAATYQQLAVHQDGREALEALRALIASATAKLDLCTFILGRDALGKEVIERLTARAREGVQVRLMIDGVGFYLGGRPHLKLLAKAGVRVALFVSPLSSPLPGRTNLRNHRKLAIADGKRVWTGGRNLASEYFTGDVSQNPKRKPWVDLSFDFSGELAQQTQQRFDQDWDFATLGRSDCSSVNLSETPAPMAMPGAASAKLAQLIASGPDQADDTIYSLLISSCFSAQTRIMVVTPYFVPDATLLLALTLAARRGVTVDLVLPLKSNHWLADRARQTSLREMAAAGARIALLPEMIHAKAILIDEGLALAGSANVDERSLFLNYELMIAFYDPVEVAQFSRWADTHRTTAAAYVPTPPGALQEFVEGLIRWLAFQL